jgi:hypothetical protein
MLAIITRGLYILNPLFEGQKLLSKAEILTSNSVGTELLFLGQ